MKRGAGPARIVVLASGNGTNLQAVLDAIAAGDLRAEVVAVVTNRSDAHALERAATAAVPAMCIERAAAESRVDYDTRLATTVADFAPDYVLLAGWMRVLSMAFLSRFHNRVVNIHPALPGQFPGAHAIERALSAAQRLGLNRTGVMVHYVPDEGVDDGPVIASVEVPIRTDDDLESLTERVHAAEHALVVSALRQLTERRGWRALR
ncbi:MAG TPA: phosphoribosylglycinamide formyltransferase [Ilumatobacteraceae bacterium]